jgi:hypothetical protein
MLLGKTNLSEERTGLAYRVSNCDGVPRVDWDSELINISADEVISSVHALSAEERTELSEAEGFLMDYLSGGPMPAAEVLKAAKRDGLSEKQVRRARERLCKKPFRKGFGPGSQSMWKLKESICATLSSGPVAAPDST